LKHFKLYISVLSVAYYLLANAHNIGHVEDIIDALEMIN